MTSAQIPPSIKNKTPWQNFVRLIEELTRDDTKGNPAKQIETVLSSGYDQYLLENYENADSRLEDLHGLAVYASRYDSTETFLSELALLSTERFKEPQPLTGEDVVSGGDDDELLTLTSVHQAKGLEWKAVFIIWAAEGKFPSPRSLKEIDSEEEERRLWYVALTRAKDELYITYPLMIIDYNRQTVLQKPSRFITECPPALFEIWSLEEEAPNFDAPLRSRKRSRILLIEQLTGILFVLIRGSSFRGFRGTTNQHELKRKRAKPAILRRSFNIAKKGTPDAGAIAVSLGAHLRLICLNIAEILSTVGARHMALSHCHAVALTIGGVFIPVGAVGLPTGKIKAVHTARFLLGQYSPEQLGALLTTGRSREMAI